MLVLSGGAKVLRVGAEYDIDLGDRFDSIGHTTHALRAMAKLRVNDNISYSPERIQNY